jgi:hypothetical protein
VIRLTLLDLAPYGKVKYFRFRFELLEVVLNRKKLKCFRGESV